MALCPPTASAAPGFDLETGNAMVEVVVPAVRRVMYSHFAPSDAPLVLRTTAVVTQAMFDAVAPFSDTAVGMVARVPRRPVAERADRARNTALLYAAREALDSLFPSDRVAWSAMLSQAGLDPLDASDAASTAAGIGRAVGRAVVAAREHDGMNQLGDADGRRFNRQPYADTTGYVPVNTPQALIDPSRWQPALVGRGHGIFVAQVGVTPQYAVTRPFTLASAAEWTVPPPLASQWASPGGPARYRAQVDGVLVASAGLTDEQKLAAELFNHKSASLGASAIHALKSRHLTLEESVQYEYLVNAAAFDGGIATWQAKRTYDAVRPFSAVAHVYGDQPVRAWGGPGQGTAALPARQWRSYLPVADHSEYPSGSACFCAAQAQASRRWLGSDDLGWSVSYRRGASVVEPGVTPRQDTTLRFDTWTDFERVCGQSRLWGGVHFQAAIDAAQPLCRSIADRAYDFVRKHVEGDVHEQLAN